MAGKRTSILRRSFAQVDLAFWCLHEHPGPLLILALPTLLLLGLLMAGVAVVIRNWDLPTIYDFALFGVVLPSVTLWVFTFAPLPCAVFAWHRASGKTLSPAECLRYLNARIWPLARISLRLYLSYVIWFLFGGLPMLWFWPRTCLVPMVVLFEKERHVLRRARRLLKEDLAVHVLAIVHLCLLLSLAALLFLPRSLAASRMLATSFTTAINDYLWVFELLGMAIVLCALAVSWCLSLTMLYYHVRQVREGESLRQRIEALRERYRHTPASAF